MERSEHTRDATTLDCHFLDPEVRCRRSRDVHELLLVIEESRIAVYRQFFRQLHVHNITCAVHPIDFSQMKLHKLG